MYLAVSSIANPFGYLFHPISSNPTTFSHSNPPFQSTAKISNQTKKQHRSALAPPHFSSLPTNGTQADPVRKSHKCKSPSKFVCQNLRTPHPLPFRPQFEGFIIPMHFGSESRLHRPLGWMINVVVLTLGFSIWEVTLRFRTVALAGL